MPTYTRGKARETFTAVKTDNNQEVYYLFKTKDLTSLANIDASTLTALGHISVASLPDGVISFLAANAPKPPRVSKRISRAAGVQQTASTFCGVPQLRSALAAGWNLAKRGRLVSLAGTRNYITALAKISTGGHYAFPMQRADFASYGAALGLVDPSTITTDAERAKIFRGASLPRPGTAKVDLDGSSFSSFYSHDAQLTGFSVIDTEVVL